jgi:UDP-glucose 4-epimerase
MIVLDACRQYKVERIIFSSSAAVYGDNQNLPLGECELVRAVSPYGAAKASFEGYLEAYSRQFGLRAVSLRYGNVYGPRQGTIGEGGVVAVFCKRLVTGKPLTIFGDGKQTRDFVFVDDVVAANLAALSCKKKYAVYNVSTQKGTTVNELARQLIAVSGRKVAVKHGAAIKGEVKHNVLANRLIKRELGWRPRVPLAEGLVKTWEWFQKEFK